MTSALQQEVTELVSLRVLSNRILVGCLALYAYDWLITLDLEINNIWTRRPSVTSVLFFCNRYLTIVISIVGGDLLDKMFGVAPPNPRDAMHWCRQTQMAAAIESNFTILPAFLLLSLRVYAIYGMSVWILALLLSVIAVDITFNIFPISLTEYTYTSFGCSDAPTSKLQILYAFAGITEILFYLLVFVLTVRKTAHHVLEARRLGMQRVLSYYILRDGAVYCLYLLLFDIIGGSLTLALNNHGGSAVLARIVTIWSTMVVFLYWIIVNRLVLNLQEGNREGFSMPTSQESSRLEMRFAPVSVRSVLGNIGSPVRVEEYSDSRSELELEYDCDVGHAYDMHCGLYGELAPAECPENIEP